MPSNYVLLERIELNATTSSVTFANIPQTGYTDLKLVASARQSTASIAADVTVQFNGTAANNFNRFIYGDSASAGSGTDGYGPSRNYFSIGVANTATANTFSNVEMYIPNYTSSNNKSFTVESVGENNGTSSVFQLMVAGLWSNSAAINQITLTPVLLESFLANSTFSLYGVAALGTTPAIAPKASGGNQIENDGTYWYHTFLSSGTFTPQTTLTCHYLVVAGGGGASRLGGAGAGGLRSTVTATGGGGTLESAVSVSTPQTVTIGAGGAGCLNTGGDTSLRGQNGSNSVFGSITSVGGGGGASGGNAGFSGGSGGGAWPGGGTGAGTAGQGYAGGGGGSDLSPYGGGGGGGAGQAGQSQQAGRVAGVGGNGVQITALATPTNTGANSGYYAGGGGGSSDSSVVTKAGGLGGGGNGGGLNAGTVNTGGGGGAQGGVSGLGGAGGSGIVIIRYTVA
jgi:hypothetical protein